MKWISSKEKPKKTGLYLCSNNEKNENVNYYTNYYNADNKLWYSYLPHQYWCKIEASPELKKEK